MNNKNNYGFVERLSEKFPSQVMVDLTEVCNLACIHCTHPEFKQSTVYGKRMLDPKFNKKMIKGTTNTLREIIAICNL